MVWGVIMLAPVILGSYCAERRAGVVKDFVQEVHKDCHNKYGETYSVSLC